MDLSQNLLRPSFYRISLTYGTERHTEAEIKTWLPLRLLISTSSTFPWLLLDYQSIGTDIGGRLTYYVELDSLCFVATSSSGSHEAILFFRFRLSRESGSALTPFY